MSTYLLPMFPLGRPVLPGEVMGLRVFEPRYVTLLDRIAGRDRPEFGVVMIDRGSEVGGGDVRRAIGTAVHAARIQPLEQGHFAVAAIGHRRIRVAEWMHDDPHPWAMVEDWPETVDHSRSSLQIDDEMVEERFEILVQRAKELSAEAKDVRPLAHGSSTLSFAQRSYALAHRLRVGPADLQNLLEAGDTSRRLSVLTDIVEHLEALARFNSSDPE